MNIKKLLSIVLSSVMLFAFIGMLPQNEMIVKAVISASYAVPTVNPPTNTHPRVLFRSGDVSRIRTNLSSSQNSAALNKLNSYAAMAMESSFTGNAGGKLNINVLNKIEAAAFDYAINAKNGSGTKAVTLLMNYLSTSGVDTASSFGNGVGNQTRNGGYVIYVVSEIYDWCYSLFTPQQRNTVISACETIAGYMEIGYPPISQSPTAGHGSEAQLLRDLMTFAIATYDERPDIWNVVGGRFYEQYVPAREYFNTANYALEGDSYGLYRHIWDSRAYLLITGMGAAAPYNKDNLYNTSYGMIYMRRPDGQYMRDGDTYADDEYMWSYWGGNSQSYLLDSSIGDDPYLKMEYARMIKDFNGFYEASPIMQLIVNKPELEPKAISNLPLSRYFGSPVGMSIARTGWEDGVDSPAVVAQMKVGEINLNNHQHLDAGHFQLYYKGILASDSGVYQGLFNNSNVGGTGYGSEHYNMYMTKSVAHNTMLVYDPDEYKVNTGFPYYEKVSTNRKFTRDGGQRTPMNNNAPETVSGILTNSKVASVAAQEIDPLSPNEPSYTYLKGDLTNAYSNKVSDYKRSFMFLNLFNDDVPGVMIVFDKITSSNASFKKSWLLHGLEEPYLKSSARTEFSRTYSEPEANNSYKGKMTVDTLLPINPTITKVGAGNKYSIVNGRYDNGKDWTGLPLNIPADEGNTWRIEVSPPNSATTDYFLNVMQVSDNDLGWAFSSVLIDSTLVYGAKISNRVVTFSKSGNKISETTTFNFSGDGNYKYTMCDMKAGTWAVTTSGGTQNVVASSDGGVLSFTAPAGVVRATYVNSSGTVIPYNPTKGNADYYSTRINNNFVYNKTAPRMESGKFVMPLSTITKYYNLTSSRNNNIIDVSTGSFTTTLTVGSKIIETNNSSVGNPELDVAVFEENGEIMVQPEGFLQLFGGDMNMNQLSKTAYITTPTAQSGANLEISYSVDGGFKFIPLSGFLFNQNNYTVKLPDNVPYVILSATADDGTVTYKVVDNYNSTKYRHAGFRYQPFNNYAQTQYLLERKTDNGMIPIKNEMSTGIVIYTDEDNNDSTYKIDFISKQPRITAFIQSEDFTDGSVTFISGGAVANDNGTIIDTVPSAVRLYALANVSSTLVGSSMFVLPWCNMFNATSAAVTEKDCEFFSFKADTDCTVVVMLAQAASPTSEYADSWTIVNDGTEAEDITPRSSPRNYNNYNNTDYFAIGYKWICGDATRDEYRVSSPGIDDGELTGTHAKAGIKFSYAYSKSFKAGETINIYNPGCITTEEVTALMPIMVKWDNMQVIPEPTELELTYSIDKKTYTTIPLNSDVGGYYNISLPPNIFKVYLNVQIPDSDSVSILERNIVDATIPALGGFNTIRMNRGSENMYELEHEIAPTTPTPIKLERGRLTVNYAASGQASKLYKIRLESQQPRVTAYSRKMSGDWNKINFLSGSAVNNDNKTILDTNTGTSNDRVWALANVSKKLEGTSLIMLPWENTLKVTNDTETYPEFVVFKADTDCTVYVLLTKPAAANSIYATDWTCVNNGIIPARFSDIERYNISRNINNYAETDYFAMAYKWIANTSTESTVGNNVIRMSNPGILGTINGSNHVTGYTPFPYVYAKEYKAGTDVSIANPGSMTSADDLSALMPVMVKWNFPNPIVTVTSISAEIASNATNLTVANTVTKATFDQEYTYNAIAAVYSDSTCKKLIEIVIKEFKENETKVTFNNTDFDNDAYVQFMVWEMETNEPFSTKFSGLLSDFLN